MVILFQQKEDVVSSENRWGGEQLRVCPLNHKIVLCMITLTFIPVQFPPSLDNKYGEGLVWILRLKAQVGALNSEDPPSLCSASLPPPNPVEQFC